MVSLYFFRKGNVIIKMNLAILLSCTFCWELIGSKQWFIYMYSCNISLLIRVEMNKIPGFIVCVFPILFGDRYLPLFLTCPAYDIIWYQSHRSSLQTLPSYILPQPSPYQTRCLMPTTKKRNDSHQKPPTKA